MLRRLLPVLLLLPLSGLTHAQTHIQVTNAVQEEDVSPAELARRLKRREELRESLKMPVESTAPVTRQLSLQEKSEMRQQLRLQRQESFK